MSIRFSKKIIENFPAHDPASPSREMEYSDSECIGLKLRVSKNGRRFFQFRYTYLSRKKCLKIGEYPHVSLNEARSKINEWKSLLAREIDPADERNQRRDEPTFSEFAEKFYIPHAQSHKITWQEDVYKIRGHINRAMGHLRLSSITTRDLTAFQSKLKDLNSATSANAHLRLIQRMLNLAIKWGFLDKNPAAGLEKFKEPPHRERYLTKDELPRFLKALEEHSDQLSMAAIKLLLYTGCRKGEILTLQWHQVRLDEGRLFLPKTKNGHSRSILLNEKAIEVLVSLGEEGEHDPQGYLFPSRGGTVKGHLHDLRKPLQKVCEAAGIDGLRVHDLRHSFATLAVMSGASLYDIQKLLGHSDISMTQRYAHMVDDNLQRATDSVSRHLSEVLGSA